MVDRAVFINYRGEDTHSYGALLYQELRVRFGDDQVFLDCESIPAGADFVAELLNRVRSAPVLLAVIGPRWLTVTDKTGCRRIDNPDDWIRRELAEAFTAGVTVIPVLTEQIAIPAEADLPAEIASLSRCQYRRLRHHDSTADLARIVTDLTRLNPTLAAIARSRDNRPRQLIGPPAGFVGRVDHLAALDRALTSPEGLSPGYGLGSGATAVISAIGGTGGIGKTWLALTWAHRNLHRFPDGQLAVDLRGFSPGDPRQAADVLADFLAALGVDHDHQPTDLDARVALYRTHTTGKRLLILLDNAATSDQVEPLLPGGTTCTVLVTSRRGLPALITRHSARPVHVDVLTETEARTLLNTALRDTHDRVDAERAATELIGLCHGFPLALGLITARITARIRTHPDLLDEIVADLRDLGLDALDSNDPTASLPTVLSWSLRHLTEQQRTLFGLLGVAPGPDATLPAVVSLTDQPPADARKTLSALEDASLLERRPGGRYVMHDLIRHYAASTAHNLPDAMRVAALERVIDFYQHTAQTAAHLLDHHYMPVQPDPPNPGTRLCLLEDVPAALAWLDTHNLHLLAAQRLAATHPRHQAVWHLASALTTFHFRRGRHHDQVTMWQVAADTAIRLPNPTILIDAHHCLGGAYAGLRKDEQAIEHLDRALALARHHDDLAQQAYVNHSLAWAWIRQQNHRRALEHARRALELIQLFDQPVWEARMLNTVGWCAAQLGDYDTARTHCQTALALLRQHHDLFEADTLDSLGYIAHHTHQQILAVDYYRQALALYRERGNTYDEASTLVRLGRTYAALGDHKQARAEWRQALQLYQVQQRTVDVERIQKQLDELDTPGEIDDSHK